MNFQEFCHEFNITISNVAWLEKRAFILTKQVPDRTVWAGTFLGEQKKNEFVPSMLLFDEFLSQSKNKIVLDEKSSWLYVCGRDVFYDGIIGGTDYPLGTYVVVVDKKNNVLGYGVMQHKGQIAVRNVLDRGILLRREMTKRK